MKNTVAILLTALLFLNFFGYRIVFYFAAQAEDIKLESTLDRAEYNDNELVTINVPLNNPYSLNQSTFERVDGEITFKGKIYKYVKRRIFNNELILLCIPNNSKMRIEENKKNFFENINDLAKDSKHGNSKAGAVKNPVAEYDVNSFGISLQKCQPTVHVIKTEVSVLLSAGYLSYQGKPPRLV